MTPEQLTCIKEHLFWNNVSVQPLSGGSCNEIYCLSHQGENVVIKLADQRQFPGLLLREREGLAALRQTNTFHIPEILSYFEDNSTAFLCMEWISSTHSSANSDQLFGQKLAELHQNTHTKFGWHTSNYIGSLLQNNSFTESMAEFYIQNRLEPQFRMASQKGFNFNRIDTLYTIVSSSTPAEPPALIHGDLWSGNAMVSARGEPCLIDPAVSYASREMDIALMKLFGGFGTTIFEAYQEVYPLACGWQDRISLWQLYYYLVHVNLFGSSYASSVQRCMDAYT